MSNNSGGGGPIDGSHVPPEERKRERERERERERVTLQFWMNGS